MTPADDPGVSRLLFSGRLAGLVAVIAALGVVGYVSGLSAMAPEDVHEWMPDSPLPAVVVFLGLFLVLNTLGLPVPALAASGGAVFGTVEGAGATLAAMWVTACVQFLMARRLGGDRLRAHLQPHLGRVGPLLARRGVVAVAAARLLPGPFSELNMAAGLTPLTFRAFALGTALGCAPKAIAWSAFGASLVAR